MIVSRVFALGRIAGIHQRGGVITRHISTSVNRPSGAPWTYREFAQADRKWEIWANVAGGIFWWWVFWHLFSDYGHIIGEKEFIDAAIWTDEELGIPPDEADDPE